MLEVIAGDAWKELANPSGMYYAGAEFYNKFMLNSDDYAIDQLMRIITALMFHATTVVEYAEALQSMKYIRHNPHKFRAPLIAHRMACA